jgi:hypothetical protein
VVEDVVIIKVDVAVPLAAGVIDTGNRLQPTVASLVAQTNPTVETKPFNEVTLTVDEVEFPIEVVTAAGDTSIAKSLIVRL